MLRFLEHRVVARGGISLFCKTCSIPLSPPLVTGNNPIEERLSLMQTLHYNTVRSTFQLK
jgi:hypothetical protein